MGYYYAQHAQKQPLATIQAHLQQTLDAMNIAAKHKHLIKQQILNYLTEWNENPEQLLSTSFLQDALEHHAVSA